MTLDEARAHIGAAPAAECRAAASKLRELAQRATPGPWRLGSDRWAALVADRKHPDRMVGREYFAAMHPLVGLAIADLLDSLADDAEQSIDDHAAYGAPPRDELVLARLINGGAS